MYRILRPFLFAMSPTRAHGVAMAALGPFEHVGVMRSAFGGALAPADPRLRVRVMGLDFSSPVGLAAGLDKNADRARAFAAMGFGHLELGTVTAQAQAPNPAPNLFRLPADRALVNRLGFPNEGAASVAERIRGRRGDVTIPIGISIGKSRSVPVESLDRVIADYLTSFGAVRDVADVVVVNVSSPNTKDLRAMQAADAARPLFDALRQANASASKRVPLLVKIAPDLDDEAIDALVDEAMRAEFAGVVATNTTISRAALSSAEDVIARVGAGGLSGRPLFARSLSVVKRVRTRLGKGPCVIGVGGVESAATTLAMMRAGADLVQLYTALVYEGPLLPRTIARDLSRMLVERKLSSLAELVASEEP